MFFFPFPLFLLLNVFLFVLSDFDIELTSVSALNSTNIVPVTEWSWDSKCLRITGHASPGTYPLYSFTSTGYMGMQIRNCSDLSSVNCDNMRYASPYFRSVGSFGYGYFGIVIKTVGDLTGYGWHFYVEDDWTRYGGFQISGLEGTDTLQFKCFNENHTSPAEDESKVDGPGNYHFSQRAGHNLADTRDVSWTEYGLLWTADAVKLLVDGRTLLDIAAPYVPLFPALHPKSMHFDFMTHCDQGDDATEYGSVDPSSFELGNRPSIHVRRFRYFAGATTYPAWKNLPGLTPGQVVGVVFAVGFGAVIAIGVIVALVFLVMYCCRKGPFAEGFGDPPPAVAAIASIDPLAPLGQLSHASGDDIGDSIKAMEDIERRHAESEMGQIVVNQSLFSVAMDEIQLVDKIGQGGFAAVYKAKYAGMVCAFKVFKTSYFGSQHDFSEFEKEVELVSSLAHENLLRFYGASCKPPKVGLLFEYCSNGDVLAYVSKNPSTSPQERLRWFRDVALCMAFLNKKGIIHRDLKPDNLLLTDQVVVKVIDLGLAKVVESLEQKHTAALGTKAYMAPEVYRGDPYDFSVDVYSYGIALFAVLAGSRPYREKILANSTFNIEAKVASDPSFRPNLEKLGDDVTRKNGWVVKLMQECWSAEASERPGFAQIEERLGSSQWQG